MYDVMPPTGSRACVASAATRMEPGPTTDLDAAEVRELLPAIASRDTRSAYLFTMPDDDARLSVLKVIG